MEQHRSPFCFHVVHCCILLQRKVSHRPAITRDSPYFLFVGSCFVLSEALLDHTVCDPVYDIQCFTLFANFARSVTGNSPPCTHTLRTFGRGKQSLVNHTQYPGSSKYNLPVQRFSPSLTRLIAGNTLQILFRCTCWSYHRQTLCAHQQLLKLDSWNDCDRFDRRPSSPL